MENSKVLMTQIVEWDNHTYNLQLLEMLNSDGYPVHKYRILVNGFMLLAGLDSISDNYNAMVNHFKAKVKVWEGIETSPSKTVRRYLFASETSIINWKNEINDIEKIKKYHMNYLLNYTREYQQIEIPLVLAEKNLYGSIQKVRELNGIRVA